MSRRSYSDQAREQLLRFWERDEGDGAAIGCVTTTYTFDAAFFEEECLARFVGLEGNPREDLRSYVVEREEKLSQVFAAVLVDQAHVARQRSLRWNLLPVRVPGGGVMHAKVTVLFWEHRIRVLIGSANLTEAAYRTNYEHVGVLDFTAESEIPLSLLIEAIDFLERLRGLAPHAQERGSGPQVALERFLLALRRRASEWESARWSRGAPTAALVPVWPAGRSLFEQLALLFPALADPQDAWILSPFFDDGDGSREVVEALVGIMAHRGERGLCFTAAGRVLPDSKTIELDLPDCLSEPWLPRVDHEFELVRLKDPLDQSEVTRWLHAKSLWLRRGERVLYSIGSSNFTRAGTGLLGARSNVELNIAYVIPARGSPFGSRCAAAAPPTRSLEEDEELRFLPPADRTPEAEASTPLPGCFGMALFRPEAEFGELLLAISGPSPAGFRVESANGELILAAETWASAGHPSTVQVPWSSEAPPSHLVVRWVDEPAATCEAIWVVNVTDGSRLPPPEELRGLELEELISILTSARPLHEAIGRVLGKRVSGPRPPDPGRNSLDKVDTRSFLIRRMRRVAAGLEGLRARLERPAHHLDALRWRLHGPVGPVALAHRLHEEEHGAGAFMLAEVALTVDRCDWSHMEASLGREVVRAEVGTVVEKIAVLASESEAPTNLAEYVSEAFEEVRG